MSFLLKTLEPPRYGFATANGELIKPTKGQILGEFFYRLNVFRDKRNWLALWGWVAAFALAVPLYFFLRYHLSLPLVVVGFLYSMVALGTHGTIYLHRFGTHRAYHVRSPFWVQVLRNLTIKIIPEETYVVSHHTHHRYAEQPGDPYNPHAGWLYCFLADVNHQMISRSLTPESYKRVAGMIAHMGVKPNSYEQYRRWGTIAHPVRTAFHFALNWASWYGVFFAIGGHALATCIFGSSAVWAFGVRTYNYDGHGGGRDKKRDGIDFNREDNSINQMWPGYVSGEWHNNHHLFPSSARNDFQTYQLDLAWIFIRTWSKLGLVTSYRDDKPEFLRRYGHLVDPRTPAAAPEGAPNA